MNVPEFFIRQSEAYKKIVELTQSLPNDQDLGKAIREYLWEIKESNNKN